MSKALDFANYTPVPTPEQVRCFLAEGYTRAIIGVSFGSVARAQIDVCAANGMDVEAFAWLRFNADWRAPIDKALATIKGTAVTRLWIDCEDATTGPQGMIESRILDAQRYIRELRRDLKSEAIYTGAWWWIAHMPTSRTFKDWDLWTASYVRDPNVPPTGQPPLYGGWQSAAMWQYAGTVQTCGLNTDRNTILEVEQEPEDEDMKPYLAWDTDRKTVYLIGPFGAAHVMYPADAKVLEGLYGPLSVALTSAMIAELAK